MELFFSIYFFIFGLLVGSFLNVVILRLPVGKDLVLSRSSCPQCGNQLRWYHNIPLLSFIFLKGQCAYCKGRISWRYPLIELFTGLVAFWLMPKSMSFESISYFLYFFIIACVFICHFFIDLDHQHLPSLSNTPFLFYNVFLAILAFRWPAGIWVTPPRYMVIL